MLQDASSLPTAPSGRPDAARSPVAPEGSYNYAADLLSRCAAHPDHPAFIDDTRTLSYGALAKRVRQCAAALLASGVRREERVLLLMHDCVDWPVAFLGALYAGVVPVAVNTLLPAPDYAWMLDNAQARTVLVSAALRPTLDEALATGTGVVQQVIVSDPTLPDHANPFVAWCAAATPAPGPAPTHADDPAFWLYSSGSTGRPKGTVHTHANPWHTSHRYGRDLLGLRADDVCFSAAKLFFAYGLGNGLTFPLTVGATVILMAGRPTPEAVFARWTGVATGGVRPTVFFGAPTGYAGMLASPALPARSAVALRLASSAGEALPADLGERFTAHFGVEIIDGIGSTEMLHIYLSNRPGAVRYGTTGTAVPGYRLELRNDEGGHVPDGEPGDLYISGPSSALFYWRNRARSSETFQGVWTRSGDKYIRNADGTYTYSGRSDDMLKVSGIYVSPFEVEATLMQHPAVLESAVIGVPDSDGLTRTKAFVVCKAGATVDSAELQAFVKERLAPFKYPRIIEFLDELPKTATGKIQRFRLRAREQGGV